MSSDPAEPRRREADDLARIGAALQEQETRVWVVLPGELADRAVAAWERTDDAPVENETPTERANRHRAGHLALVGTAVRDRGRRVGENVEVELDAWQVGVALEAADDGGLLG